MLSESILFMGLLSAGSADASLSVFYQIINARGLIHDSYPPSPLDKGDSMKLDGFEKFMLASLAIGFVTGFFVGRLYQWM